MSEIKGKIKTLGKEQTFGSNGFRKTELVVLTEDQYPQPILVEFVQGKCDLVKNLKVGQEVSISYNLRGREWVSPQGETKYFNTIQGWRIEAGPVPNQAPPKPQSQAPNPSTLPQEEEDDLPF